MNNYRGVGLCLSQPPCPFGETCRNAHMKLYEPYNKQRYNKSNFFSKRLWHWQDRLGNRQGGDREAHQGGGAVGYSDETIWGEEIEPNPMRSCSMFYPKEINKTLDY